jgi:hypothetical protein
MRSVPGAANRPGSDLMRFTLPLSLHHTLSF